MHILDPNLKYLAATQDISNIDNIRTCIHTHAVFVFQIRPWFSWSQSKPSVWRCPKGQRRRSRRRDREILQCQKPSRQMSNHRPGNIIFFIQLEYVHWRLHLSFHGDCKCSIGYVETKSSHLMDLLIDDLILIVGARVKAYSVNFSVAEFVVSERKVKFLVHFKLVRLWTNTKTWDKLLLN